MELETSHYGIFKAVCNILKRLPKGSRKKFILLVLAMVCVAGFETLTLGSIALLASGVSDPETIKQSVYFINIQNYLNLDLFSTNRGLIMTLSVTVFCLVICRNALLGLITFASGRYAANINGYIGEIFLLGFLRLPYEWHLNQNSADLVTTINWRQFFGLFINTLLLALSDAFVVLAMLAILMIVEPAVSILVIIIIGMVAFLILRNVRGILDRIAKRCEILGKSINRYVTRALHGVKDVKVYGKEDFFVSDYNDEAYRLAHLEALKQLITRAPTWFLEITGFGLLTLAICLMLLMSNASNAKITGTLALFVVTAWRVLPAMNRILGGLTQLRTLLPYVYNGFKYLYEIDEHQDEKIKPKQPDTQLYFNRALRIDRVSFRYQNDKSMILKDISFSVQKGQTVGIIGHSGAGKSTLVDVIIGLLPPTYGNIVIDNSFLTTANRQYWTRNIGYVSQTPYIYDGTLAENIAFGVNSERIDRKRVLECCKLASMDDFLKNLPDGIDTRIGERGVKLSGGQRQRVAISRALYNRPGVLIFDEATSSLDTETEKAIQKTIYSLKGEQTLIIVAHRLSTIEDCDILIWIEEGKIKAKGQPDVILSNYNNKYNKLNTEEQLF
jgi:ABC-type multidrug transport system fused ATPase/permease subunit